MKLLAGLQQLSFRCLALLLLVVLGYVACSGTRLAQPEPLTILLVLAGVLLWAIGRVGWSRAATKSRDERPKSRRRALPPAPRWDETDGSPELDA